LNFDLFLLYTKYLIAMNFYPERDPVCYTNLVSKIHVEELLENNPFYKILMALRMEVSDHQTEAGKSLEVGLKTIANLIDELKTTEYMKDGKHRGDCTHDCFTCSRCLLEDFYTEVYDMINEWKKIYDDDLINLVAFLLSQEEEEKKIYVELANAIHNFQKYDFKKHTDILGNDRYKNWDMVADKLKWINEAKEIYEKMNQ